MSIRAVLYKAIVLISNFLLPYYISAASEKKLNIDSVRAVLSAMKDDTNKVNYLHNFFFNYHAPLPMELLFEFHKEALRIELKFPYKKRQAYAYRKLGNIYFEKFNNYEKALENYFISLKIAESINDKEAIANCLNNIGNAYLLRAQNIGNNYDYHQALKYHNQALAIREKYSTETSVIANSYLNTGNVYMILGNYDKAAESFKKCMEIYIKNNDVHGIALSYISFGELYTKKGDYAEALNYFSKCLNHLGKEIGYTIECNIYNSVGIIYFKKKLPDISLEYFKKALAIAEQYQLKEELKISYEHISEIYALKNNYEQAYQYFRQYTRIKDTLLNVEGTKNIARLQLMYESEKKEKEIFALKQDKEIQELKINQQNLKLNQRQSQIIALISGLLFVVLVVIFLYSRSRVKQKEVLNRQKIKQQELISKAIIEAEQKERERIARDLHDGIGQLLSAAKLNVSGLEHTAQFKNTDDTKALKNAIGLIDESVKEIRNISHNMLPGSLIKGGLVQALEDFISKVNNNKFKIKLQVHDFNQRLEPASESVLYRIIQEIIGNIIKHAKATSVSVQIIKHENELVIMIEDDGVGFDVNKVQQNSMGLKNIESRVAYLKGKVNFDSSPGSGTTVVIEIPMN